jgi:hypothetical protein
VQPDGGYEVSYFNITGQSYNSINEIFESGGKAAAYALSHVNASGALIIYSDGVSVSVTEGALSVTLQDDMFDANSDTFNIAYHATEVFNVVGTKDDAFAFAAPTGARATPWTDVINGFMASGVGSDMIEFNASAFGVSNATTAWDNLLASATTNSAGWEVIHDNSHDTLTLSGVNRAALLSIQSDFKFV